MENLPHKSVLLKEFLSFFEGKEIRYFIDGTVGAGGHSEALLKAHPEIEKLIGFDQDPLSLEIASKRLKDFEGKVELILGNFRNLSFLTSISKVDGIFFDFGVSSMQLDQAEKGFSFSKDGPLDMRMDPSISLTAAKVVNSFSEKELTRIFEEYGEDPRSRRAAKAIVEARRKKAINTTFDLVDALKTTLTWGGRRNKNIHPMTLIFQALRIYVNDELNAIKEALDQAMNKLAKGGLLGAISFHSLEDRIVKETFRSFSKDDKGLILTKKPLQATFEEVRSNPRSRSAKMRFLQKL